MAEQSTCLPLEGNSARAGRSNFPPKVIDSEVYLVARTRKEYSLRAEVLIQIRFMTPNEREQSILDFWEKNNILQKSIDQSKNWKPFSFYDGPPFATGLPHYGHILATAIKDTVIRYWYMQGFAIDRRVGWDCHGLPIENLIEKEIGIAGGKKEIIEKYGIETFNAACAASVFRCVADFEKTLKRVGRWADYKNAYATMDTNYTESVWWVFSELYKQGLVYEDYRVTPYCPRCGTPLSNFEVNQGYKDVNDQSICVAFALVDEPDTSFLVWTTTPWTLPSNVAIAVGSSIAYVKVKKEKHAYWIAKDLVGVMGDGYSIVDEALGKTLIDKKYEPLYRQPNTDTAYRIVVADFVSTGEGTGLVHMAPAFGEDDMRVGKQENLPVLITVDLEGNVKHGHGIPGEGLFVKKADDVIVRDLESRSLLYKRERIVHSYPFCWRCDSPLLYYPINSWYVAVTKIKDQLVTNNKKIHWVPEHVKEGRFGKWLEGARDWCISRNRFWGAPLPIWRCKECKAVTALGSLAELREHAQPARNGYFIMRHGQADHNLKHIVDCDPTDNSHLTDEGKKQVTASAANLKDTHFDYIFGSDFACTKETGAIVADIFGVDSRNIIYDERLREINAGDLQGKTDTQFYTILGDGDDKLTRTPEGGESLISVRERMMGFIGDIESRYEGKTILIVSHDYPLWMLQTGARGLTNTQSLALLTNQVFIDNAQVKPLDYTPIPHNADYVLDLHRPYIDAISLLCNKCSKPMHRVEEVFDCWFESGSMPYAQWHYPFENKEKVEQSFPADFIAEGMDQTRGWFYTLHVLATALTQTKSDLGEHVGAFTNVVTNGLILGEDGKKLSKRLKNYPSLDEVLETSGADALRYFLLASSPIGEDYIVSRKRIEETARRIIGTLENCYSFYAMYAGAHHKPSSAKSANILDQWIISRINTLVRDVTKEMNGYELTRASRLFDMFIDGLSNWYVRRSRSRFQKSGDAPDSASAVHTLKTVLFTCAQIIAPFTPFIAEEIYQKLKSKSDPESVHLCRYPVSDATQIDTKLEASMDTVRTVVAGALALRAQSGIKIRQPLARLVISEKLDADFTTLIADEINVKTVELGKKMELDSVLTPQLIAEGNLRELERAYAGMRKQLGLSPADVITSVAVSDAHLLAREVPAAWRTKAFGSIDANIQYDATIEVALNGATIILAVQVK